MLSSKDLPDIQDLNLKMNVVKAPSKSSKKRLIPNVAKETVKQVDYEELNHHERKVLEGMYILI